MISIFPLRTIQSSFVLQKSFLLHSLFPRPYWIKVWTKTIPILSSDKFSFHLVSKNLHLTLKNRSEYTGDLISTFLCEPQKSCECGQNATLTFAILLATCEGVSKRSWKVQLEKFQVGKFSLILKSKLIFVLATWMLVTSRCWWLYLGDNFCAQR